MRGGLVAKANRKQLEKLARGSHRKAISNNVGYIFRQIDQRPDQRNDSPTVGKREITLTAQIMNQKAYGARGERPSKIFEEEHKQAVSNRISPMPRTFSDPVSLGGLCQAMFIEAARVLGYTGEALMPKEVQEQVFLAATLIADGLGRLLQNQDDAEQEIIG